MSPEGVHGIESKCGTHDNHNLGTGGFILADFRRKLALLPGLDSCFLIQLRFGQFMEHCSSSHQSHRISFPSIAQFF